MNCTVGPVGLAFDKGLPVAVGLGIGVRKRRVENP
jgi:hypothetical protein